MYVESLPSLLLLTGTEDRVVLLSHAVSAVGSARTVSRCSPEGVLHLQQAALFCCLMCRDGHSSAAICAADKHLV